MAILAEKLLPTFGINEAVNRKTEADDWLVLGIDPLKADQVMAKALNHIDETETILS